MVSRYALIKQAQANYWATGERKHASAARALLDATPPGALFNDASLSLGEAPGIKPTPHWRSL